MAEIPVLPEVPLPGERPAYVDALLEVVAALREVGHQQREDIQVLRDDVARLKKP